VAPEIIQMNRPSSACDIWSLGCTIIELVSGSPPYFVSVWTQCVVAVRLLLAAVTDSCLTGPRAPRRAVQSRQRGAPAPGRQPLSGMSIFGKVIACTPPLITCYCAGVQKLPAQMFPQRPCKATECERAAPARVDQQERDSRQARRGTGRGEAARETDSPHLAAQRGPGDVEQRAVAGCHGREVGRCEHERGAREELFGERSDGRSIAQKSRARGAGQRTEAQQQRGTERPWAAEERSEQRECEHWPRQLLAQRTAHKSRAGQQEESLLQSAAGHGGEYERHLVGDRRPRDQAQLLVQIRCIYSQSVF
jgi:hypothetical protein